MLSEITRKDFEKEVINSNEPILVDFYTEWCKPCSALSSIVEKISIKYKNNLKVYKINIDYNSDLATYLSINSIPTLILFKDSKPVKKLVGYKPEAAIEKEIKEYLS